MSAPLLPLRLSGTDQLANIQNVFGNLQTSWVTGESPIYEGVIILFKQISVVSKPEKNLAGQTECSILIMLSEVT